MVTIVIVVKIKGTTNSGKSLEIRKRARISSPTTRTSLSFDVSMLKINKYICKNYEIV